MRSAGPTSSIFCFPPSGRTHSNCVSAPPPAPVPMAHPSPYKSRGLAEEDLDGFARLRFLAFISRWQSIACPREPQRVLKGRVPAGEGGLGGKRGLRRRITTRSCLRRPPGFF